MTEEYPDFHGDMPITHSQLKGTKESCGCGKNCSCGKGCDCKNCGCDKCSTKCTCGGNCKCGK
mgnify:CR=1 FL=1